MVICFFELDLKDNEFLIDGAVWNKIQKELKIGFKETTKLTQTWLKDVDIRWEYIMELNHSETKQKIKLKNCTTNNIYREIENMLNDRTKLTKY